MTRLLIIAAMWISIIPWLANCPAPTIGGLIAGIVVSVSSFAIAFIVTISG